VEHLDKKRTSRKTHLRKETLCKKEDVTVQGGRLSAWEAGGRIKKERRSLGKKKSFMRKKEKPERGHSVEVKTRRREEKEGEESQKGEGF